MAPPKLYNTAFPLTENPITENGIWLNGLTPGLDWLDVQTTPGLAFGTGVSIPSNLNDSTALLTGVWAPNQFGLATVHTVNQQTGAIYEEVEIRLRSSVSAHVCTGYEMNFRCNHDGTQYVSAARWNGAINQFTQGPSAVAPPGLFDGDTVTATIIGKILTAYVNGVALLVVDITTDFGGGVVYTTGNPGIGFFLEGGAIGLASDYGFTAFQAGELAI